ncbi:hypothetical protein [Micrococcus luteus]|uniref:hypothetical protein n=1 Tax=Micrococcus luteus TaxID=1270 RepID=UPI0034DB5E25
MSDLLRPCITCGELSLQARCGEHQLQRTPKAGANELGYDYAWQKLSARARRLQPFCEDCGSPEDLTADHSVEAWKRKAAGKVIRLRDISVVCRRCNSERGAARGEKASDQWRKTWGEGVADDVLDRRAKAKFPTDCESFSTEEVG